MPRYWTVIKWISIVTFLGLSTIKALSRTYAPDEIMQITAGIEWARGTGIALPWAQTEDVSQTTMEPLSAFPPGYSLIFGALYRAFGDIWLSTLLIHLLGTYAVILSWLFILETLGQAIGEPLRALLWLFWAATGAFPLYGWSNLVALAFFSMGLAACAYLLRSPRNFILHGCIAGACFGAASAVRYAYGPLLVVVPAAFAVGALMSMPRLWYTAASSALTGGAIWGIVEIWMLSKTGHANFLHRYASDSWRWSALFRFDAFPLYAFGFDGLWNRLLSGALGPVGDIPQIGRWLIGLGLLIPVIVACIRVFVGYSPLIVGVRNRIFTQFFIVTGILLTVITVAVLVYMDLRQVPRGRFLYINEERYYALVSVFFPVALAIFLRGTRVDRFGGVMIGASVLCATLLPGTTRSVLSQLNHPRQTWFSESVRVKFSDLLARAAGSGKLVYVERADNWVDYIAFARENYAMNGQSAWGKDHSVLPLRTSEPVKLLIASHSPDLPDLPTFVGAAPHGELRRVGSILDVNLFAVDLMPDKARL